LRKLRSIQVLRGVAACGVALMHARYWADNAGPYESWTRIGAAGVDLFFVISGFIMATIPKPSVKEFAFDRFWRIYPMWWVALLPWLLFVTTTASQRFAMVALWPVTNMATVPFLQIRWTLSFELLFYAAVALSVRRGPWIPLAVFAVALLTGLWTRHPAFNFFGNPMIFEFLFGVILAKLPRSALAGRFVLPVAVLILAIAPLDLFLVKLALTPSASWIRVLMWGFPAALIVYAALSNESLFQRRAVMPFVVLGDASYSIYLFHPLATTVLHLPWPVEFVLAVSLGVGAWWLIERRLLAAKRRFAGLPVRTARPWTTQPLQR
jgi:exopolysaccharide production protein ExoZ